MRVPGVTPIDPRIDPRWDEYVRSHQRGTAYHLGAWAEILKRSYRFQPRYVALQGEGDRFRGVLPMVTRWGPLTGRRLESLPAIQLAGPLADHPDAAAELLGHAEAGAAKANAMLRITSRLPDLAVNNPGLQQDENGPSWILDLQTTEDEDTWLAARSKNLRRSIKTATSSDLTVELSSDPADLATFYELYLLTMRKHRSLPRLFRQLELTRTALGQVFRLFVVRAGTRCVAGGVFHTLGETIDLHYNASDPAMLKKRPNHLLYKHVIDWARVQGYRYLDFGAAPTGGPLANFKAAWGAEPTREWTYSLRDHTQGAAPSGRAVDAIDADEQPADTILASVWKRAPWAERAWGHAPIQMTRAASAIAYRYL